MTQYGNIQEVKAGNIEKSSRDREPSEEVMF